MSSRHATKNLRYIGAFGSLGDADRFWSDWHEDGIRVVGRDGSSFGYIAFGDIYQDFVRTETMARLGRIAQLGGSRFNQDVYPASHTRLYHSIVTAILGEVVGERLGLSQKEINLLIVSCLLHDSAITPLSDFVNTAIPYSGVKNGLGEEENIDFILQRPELQGLFEKYDIDPNNVSRMIKGQYPILGGLVNSDGIDLDKISYTMVDLWSAGKSASPSMRRYAGDDTLDIDTDIEIVDGQVVFRSPERVGKFLLLRATMFDQVYFHPQNKAKEAFFRQRMRELIEKRAINPIDLMMMNDDEFVLGYMERLLSYEEHRDFFSSFSPFREIGRYYGDRRDIDYLSGDGIVIEESKPFTTGTATKVFVGKKVLPFKDVDPEVAGRVDNISKKHGYFGVYAHAPGEPPYMNKEDRRAFIGLEKYRESGRVKGGNSRPDLDRMRYNLLRSMVRKMRMDKRMWKELAKEK